MAALPRTLPPHCPTDPISILVFRMSLLSQKSCLCFASLLTRFHSYRLTLFSKWEKKNTRKILCWLFYLYVSVFVYLYVCVFFICVFVFCMLWTFVYVCLRICVSYVCVFLYVYNCVVLYAVCLCNSSTWSCEKQSSFLMESRLSAAPRSRVSGVLQACYPMLSSGWAGSTWSRGCHTEAQLCQPRTDGQAENSCSLSTQLRKDEHREVKQEARDYAQSEGDRCQQPATLTPKAFFTSLRTWVVTFRTFVPA